MSEFDGGTYEPDLDRDRLLAQLERVRTLMKDGIWRTLFEISGVTHDPVQSVSARLRDLRKLKFGSHTVNRRRIDVGLFEYQLILAPAPPGPETAQTDEGEIEVEL